MREEAKLFDRFEHSIETIQADKPLSGDDKEFEGNFQDVTGQQKR